MAPLPQQPCEPRWGRHMQHELSQAVAQACMREGVLVCHLHRGVPALQGLLKGLDAALASGSLTLLAQATCSPGSSTQGARSRASAQAASKPPP